MSKHPGSEGRFSKLKSTRIHLEDEDESWVRGFLIEYLSIILAKRINNKL